MLRRMFSRFFQGRKPKIKAVFGPPPVVEEPVKVLTTQEKLRQLAQSPRLDEVLTDTVIGMQYLTMYNPSIVRLMDDIVRPSNNVTPTLTGVSIFTYFKDSHLSPTLTVERLAGLLNNPPKSTYAQHDIEMLISDLTKLLGGSDQP